MESAESPLIEKHAFAHLQVYKSGRYDILYGCDLIDKIFRLNVAERNNLNYRSIRTKLDAYVASFLSIDCTARQQTNIKVDGKQWHLIIDTCGHQESNDLNLYLRLRQLPETIEDNRFIEISHQTTNQGAPKQKPLAEVISPTHEDSNKAAYELTENIPVGTYTMVLKPSDEIAHFHFVSKRFLEITGLTQAEAQMDPFRAFECVHPSDLPAWIEKNQLAFESRTPFREETRLLIDGKVRWVVAESIPRLLDNDIWVWEGVIQDITDQKEAEASLARANAALLEQKEIEGRLSERQSILRDMHDGLGAHLILAAIRLNQGKASPKDAYQTLQLCIADLRMLIDTLDGTDNGLNYCLENLSSRVAVSLADTKISTSWNLDIPEEYTLSSNSTLNILRITNEAVMNAIRHADCNTISVTASADDSLLQLEITDDGIGFDVSMTYHGRGLPNMKQRAKQYGFDLQVRSGNFGTKIELSYRPGD